MEISPVSPDQPLHTDADLLRWARFINHGLDPVRRTLWVMYLDRDDVPLPVILPVEEMPSEPDSTAPQVARNLAKVGLDMAPGGAMVVMLERPGPARRAPADDAWHSLIRREVASCGVRLRAMFLAARGQVQPFALDDAA